MEIIATPVQEVAVNNNVLFTDYVVDGCDVISHRTGSGQIRLHALPNRCFTRFFISFNGNIAVPADGTAGAISIAIASDGEADLATNAVVTPTVVSAFFNVSASTYVHVKRGCCMTVSIKNTSTQDIEVENANLIAVVR